LYQIKIDGLGNGFGSVFDFEFGEYAFDMVFDGVRADVQLPGDIFVFQA
jgi:hypothetical protein